MSGFLNTLTNEVAPKRAPSLAQPVFGMPSAMPVNSKKSQKVAPPVSKSSQYQTPSLDQGPPKSAPAPSHQLVSMPSWLMPKRGPSVAELSAPPWPDRKS